MSLLDRGCSEDVIVFPEEVVADIDGNVRTRPSITGIAVKARLQVQGQSGTSSRRQEQDNEGYESEKIYTIRFPRSFSTELGASTQIEWRGERWSLFGDANRYTSSPRTTHLTYTIKRY